MRELVKIGLKIAGKTAMHVVRNETFRRGLSCEVKFYSNCSTKLQGSVAWNQGRISITSERIILKASSAMLGVAGKGIHLDQELANVRIAAKLIKAGMITHDGISITHGASEYLLIGLKANELISAIG